MKNKQYEMKSHFVWYLVDPNSGHLEVPNDGRRGYRSNWLDDRFETREDAIQGLSDFLGECSWSSGYVLLEEFCKREVE